MSETIKVDFPVYGGQFYDNNTAIIAGGGGEGNFGIPNKISVLSVDMSRETGKIKIANEFIIKEKNDSPVSLALSGGTILIGQNESIDNLKKGSNKHLRKFKFDPKNGGKKNPLKFIKAVDVENSKDPNCYQKYTVISADGSLAAVACTQIPGTLRIIDPSTLDVKKSIQLKGKDEIQDIAINSKGTKIAYITQRTLNLIQDGDKPTLTYNKFSSNYSLSKVKFSKDDDILLGVNLKNGAGVLLLQSIIIKNEETNLYELKTKKAKVITDTFKKMTSLDISQDDNQFIAVAGNNNTIVISDFQTFNTFKILKNVHSFAISKVSFSPNGQSLLSVSAANTVNIYQIPSNIRFTIKPYLTSIFFLILAIVAHNFFSRITDDQWTEFNKTIAYLYGEEYTPASSSGTITPPSTIQSATGGLSSDTTAATFVTGTVNIEYEYETVIKEGDIVEVKTNTVIKDDEQIAFQDEPVYMDAEAVLTDEEKKE